MPFTITRAQTFEGDQPVAVADAMKLFTTRDLACHFRDVGKYTSWSERRDGSISAEHEVSALGFRKTVRLELRPRWRSIEFEATVPGIMESRGVWTFSDHWRRDGKITVALRQHVRSAGAVGWFLPVRRLAEKRVARVFEDVGKYLAGIRGRSRASESQKFISRGTVG